MISRVKDFDRIFLYVVAGVALVGLIGLGLYSLKGGGNGGPKHISAVGAAHSQTTSQATSPSSAAAAQVITTLPAVPLPSISNGSGAVPASAHGHTSAKGGRPTTKDPRRGRRSLVRKGSAQTTTTAGQTVTTKANNKPPRRRAKR